jgi:hypothetical protein
LGKKKKERGFSSPLPYHGAHLSSPMRDHITEGLTSNEFKEKRSLRDKGKIWNVLPKAVTRAKGII